MMPLVDPPKVFGMGESMYPIMPKIGQDEIGSDSCDKGQIGYARWYQVMGYNYAVEINPDWQYHASKKYIGDEVSPNDRKIGELSSGPDDLQCCKENCPAKKQQIEEDSRRQYKLEKFFPKNCLESTHKPPKLCFLHLNPQGATPATQETCR
jgi:hypothetical protein